MASVCGSWGAGPSPPQLLSRCAFTLSRLQPPSSQNGDQPPPFPPATGHLTTPSHAPRVVPAPQRRPNSLRECAAGRHAPGARAARGARARTLWAVRATRGHARAPALRVSGAPRERARLRVRAWPAGGRHRGGGGRWEARKARGLACEPPGSGKTRLLMPLPPSPSSLSPPFPPLPHSSTPPPF